MRTIIVGADGTIGAALAQALARRGDVVYGTTRRPSTVTKSRLFLDLATFDADSIFLPDVDVVFFCAAIVSYAQCRANAALARQVNVTAPAALARRLSAGGTRVVLLSTSAVFDGRISHVPAIRTPCPVTLYGELAAEAEKQLSALSRDTIIVRLTKLITPTSIRFLRWIDELSHTRQVTAFSDLRMAPISLDDTIAALLAVAADPAGGIYQVSGAADISYYDAARHLASRLRVDPALVVEERAIDAGIPPEEIPQFSSLDTMRFTEMTGRLAPDPYTIISSVFSKEFEARQVR